MSPRMRRCARRIRPRSVRSHVQGERRSPSRISYTTCAPGVSIQNLPMSPQNVPIQRPDVHPEFRPDGHQEFRGSLFLHKSLKGSQRPATDRLLSVPWKLGFRSLGATLFLDKGPQRSSTDRLLSVPWNLGFWSPGRPVSYTKALKGPQRPATDRLLSVPGT